MNEHNEIVRRQIGEHAGQEVKTAGDSFMVAFDSARKAVECAVGVQRALHDYNRRHPAHPVKVRIGLHTGEAIRAGNDLFGTSVDAAARIMAKADGEQILVSDVLKSILGAAKDLGFKDHKRVQLKGFPERWRLWEVSLALRGRDGCRRSRCRRGAFRYAASRRTSDGRRNGLCCARR